MQKSTIGPALAMHFDLRKDVRGILWRKKETLLSLVNIHAVNENGDNSVTIDKINQQIVNVEAINFSLPQQEK